MLEERTAALVELGNGLIELGGVDGLLARSGPSALKFIELLASACPEWHDTRDTRDEGSGTTLQFMKRAQLCAAVLNRAGLVTFDDTASMTVFSDYRIPQVRTTATAAT